MPKYKFMKKFIAVAVLLLASVSVFAHNVVVKGTIVDSLSREAESYAVVQFLDGSNNVKAFTMTDENGTFKQNLPEGEKYTLLFSNMGRKDLALPFSLSDADLDLGVIAVEPDYEALNAAKVVAQENLVKMDVDKMTYKVSEDVDSKTGTVLDMLRKVPMVSVDGQDKITVNGSSNFQVLVDGKPNQMLSSNPSEIFKVMPASAVKTIDVITNPGVKFDAEGVGGVLNITTNKDMTQGASITDGQYGTVRLNGGTRGAGAGVFYNAQKGKLSVGINANANLNHSPGTIMDDERIQTVEEGENITRNHSESMMKTPMAMVDVEVAYDLDSLNTFSVTAGFLRFNMENEGNSSMEMIFANGLKTGYDGLTSMQNSRNSITASADYMHTWAGKPERNLVISYQFGGAPSVNNTYNTYGGVSIPGYDLTDRKTLGGSNSLNHILQTDFTTPMGSHSTLNAGLKLQLRHNSSEQTNYLWDGNDFLPTEKGSLDYHFRNTIGAAYAEYNGKFGPVGIKGGLRYEQTWQNVEYLKGNGEDFSLKYGNLVPTASVQWNITRTQNIGLSYNMRINRPGITYLNPYVDISNPFSISYGNSDLRTESINNISLVYNIYTPKFMMNNTLRYSISNNGISEYSFFDSDNVMNTTFGNILKNRGVTLNSFIMYTPGKKTRITFNGSVGYNEMSSDLLAQSNGGWSSSLMLGFQQTLPWDLRLSANVIASGSSVSLQGRTNGMSLGTAGLTKSFLQDKLSISVRGVCGLRNFKYLEMKSSMTGAGFTSESAFKVPMSQASVSISYSFGKNNMSQQRRRTIRRNSEDDEINTSNMSESMNSMMQF